MTARFPGLVVADWRTRLVHDHRRLFPNARVHEASAGPALASVGWPNVPDGWRDLVETACRRLESAVAAEPDAELVVLDMKEKYGGLRLDIGAMNLGDEARDAVRLAVDLAEARSTHVCDVCGRLGRLWERGGWYATRCEEHSEGHEPVRSRYRDIELSVRIVDGKVVRTARRYVVETDTFEPFPLPIDEEE